MQFLSLLAAASAAGLGWFTMNMRVSTANVRPQRADSELMEAAEAVVYEVIQLQNAINMWAVRDRLDPGFVNAIIESFLVHYRNLRDFLYPPQSYQNPDIKNRNYGKITDTALALDFNPSWTRDSVKWKNGLLDSNESARINKMLAHVSYSRKTFPKPWDLAAMGSLMKSKMTEFLDCLPIQRRQWFEKAAPVFPQLSHP